MPEGHKNDADTSTGYLRQQSRAHANLFQVNLKLLMNLILELFYLDYLNSLPHIKWLVRILINRLNSTAISIQ